MTDMQALLVILLWFGTLTAVAITVALAAIVWGHFIQKRCPLCGLQMTKGTEDDS